MANTNKQTTGDKHKQTNRIWPIVGVVAKPLVGILAKQGLKQELKAGAKALAKGAVKGAAIETGSQLVDKWKS